MVEDMTEDKLNALECELANVVDACHDTVCIYRIDAPKFVYKNQIGVVDEMNDLI